MWIKVEITQKGCDDDNLNLVKTYHEGETYEMGEGLGEVFIEQSWGKKVKKPKTSKKDEGDADENKEEALPEGEKK